MNEQIKKIVDGVTYERNYHSVPHSSCRGCVAFLKESFLCAKLLDDNCSHKYVYKIKDITKQPKVQESLEGVKYDQDKIKYSLVPPYALEAVAKNLTSGLKKYKEVDNWKKVPNAEDRYLNALYRHLEQHRKGEIYDKDNIDPTNTHLAAVVVNGMFLLEFLLNPELNKEKTND